jgi:capsid protein
MGVRNWLAQQILSTRHGRQQGQRMYEAARRNRLLHDLVAPTTSADAELRVSLAVLRDRSHMLVRDNPYARQAKRTTQINVVGPRGIQMQGQIMKAGGTEKAPRVVRHPKVRFDADERQKAPGIDVGAIVTTRRPQSIDGSTFDDGRRLLHQLG